MMSLTPEKAISWIKSNKLPIFFGFLAIVVLYWIKQPVIPMPRYNQAYPESGAVGMMAYDQSSPIYDAAAQRVTMVTSYLSLLVTDVEAVISELEKEIVTAGGYVLTKHVNVPEFGKSGFITVRIPNNTRDDFLQSAKNLSVRVVSENIENQDITEQYIDIQARLARLEDTKAKMEEILESATTVEDLVQLQNQISYLQEQIDNLKGSYRYLTESATSTLITINLSTDELGLPYAPESPFRPEIVFKQAVRSLLTTFQSVAYILIWLLVWAAVFIPLIYITKWTVRFIRSRRKVIPD